MGSLTIVNALGVDVEIIEASPYQFMALTIKNGQPAVAKVSTDFEQFKLKIGVLKNVYSYDLNKGHWYGGDGNEHYPNPNSKVNIILTGDRGSYIETSYNYAPDNTDTMCKYASDTKALDKV
ncbi:TPA: hypothetical protein ACSP3U_003689 [Aeromonas hydrophila]